MAIAIGMNVPQTIEQFRALCQQAETYSQHPPENGQVLTDMHEQFLIALGRFPDEEFAVNAAIGHIGQALGRIGDIFRAEMREMERARQATPHQGGEGDVLQPQVEEQLIPPDPAVVNQIADQFMEIANDHFAQQRAPQPALATQSVPESNRLGGIMTAVGAPPHIPAPVLVATTPITNVSTTPSQQPVALEPSMLNKILQIFQSAIETLCSCFASFIAYCSSYCSGSSAQQSVQTVTPPGELQTTQQQQPQIPAVQSQQLPTPAQPPVPASNHQEQPAPIPAAAQPARVDAPPPVPAPAQPQAPAQNSAQNQEQLAPVPAQPAVAEAPVNLVPNRFQGAGHIEQGLDRGHQCINAMATRLGNHLVLGNRDENRLSDLITAAVADPNANPVGAWNFPRYGVHPSQNYRTEMGLILASAVQTHQIKAVKVIKGDEVHLVMIDARNRNELKFYYFNSYAENAYLQKFDRLNALTDHLAETLPIDVNIPFTLTGFQPLQN